MEKLKLTSQVKQGDFIGVNGYWIEADSDAKLVKGIWSVDIYDGRNLYGWSSHDREIFVRTSRE